METVEAVAINENDGTITSSSFFTPRAFIDKNSLKVL